ncbi:MAG: hypothetical protein NUV91_02905, partial [Candidatus Omnitrophica bacterium]|nr:hypothetical protein [Candidatus Omnitrophota bacterium]
AQDRSGYIWGKPATESNVLRSLGILYDVQGKSVLNQDKLASLNIEPTDIIAESWIASDDRQYPSFVVLPSGETVPLPTVLALKGPEILGKKHVVRYGSAMRTVMKLLDTHHEPLRGSLSIQVHPQEGHSWRPAKPEMWRGKGRVYLGWKQDVTPPMIHEAIKTGQLEKFLNAFDLDESMFLVVPGGAVHAIRYDTFLCEWSKAPAPEDKGTISDATVGLYDQTDGKRPRPGKEDWAGALDIFLQAKSFSKQSDFFVKPQKILDEKGTSIDRIFSTPDVIVEEMIFNHPIKIPTASFGFPLYVQDGEIDVCVDGRYTDRLQRGDSCLLPAYLKEVELKPSSSSTNAKIYRWYPPYGMEV